MELEWRARSCVPMPVRNGKSQGVRASYLRRQLDDFRMRLRSEDLSITPAPPILANRNSAIFANQTSTSFSDRYSTKVAVLKPPT